MTDGVTIALKHATILYQIGGEGEVPEPAILLRYYDGGNTFGIVQGDSEINLNVETLPLLIKELRTWKKIIDEL